VGTTSLFRTLWEGLGAAEEELVLAAGEDSCDPGVPAQAASTAMADIAPPVRSTRREKPGIWICLAE
jgi:hypothetical protein